MAGTYQDFLYALGASESSNRYDFVSGPAGYYQATEPALMAVGYYRWDGTSANDLNNGWTGKDGINSLSDFLNNPAVQDKWVGEWFTYLWNTEFNDLGIKQYIGQSIGGVTITESGLLAGAHLVGAPALADYLRSGGTSGQADPNGTTAATYIAKFAGYDAGPVTGTGGDGFPSSAAANEGSSATVPAETVSLENPVQVLPASQTAAETPAAGNTSVEPPVSSSPPGDTAPEQLPSDATAPTATTEGDPTLPLVQPALSEATGGDQLVGQVPSMLPQSAVSSAQPAAAHNKLVQGDDGPNDLLGTSGRNLIDGHGGDDLIAGKGGRDKLIGGHGHDTFVFDTPPGKANVSLILDLDPAEDTIALDHLVFSALAQGPLSSDTFRVGKKALDADDHVIYNPKSGALFYDPDGKGGTHQLKFAIVKHHEMLSWDDFGVM